MNNLKIEDLIVDFDFFDNWEDKYKYIIELGKNCPSLDENEKRLFQDGDKPALRREIEASVLEEIQLAMVNAGADKEVKEAKADLKS